MDVTINPLSKAIGAEILGIDLSEKVDPEDLFHSNAKIACVGFSKSKIGAK